MAKMTPEEQKHQDAEFAAGFNEDQPRAPEQSDDDVFGRTGGDDNAAPANDAPAAGDKPNDPDQQTDDAEGAADGGAEGANPAVAVVIAPDAAGGTDVAPEGQGGDPTDPKEIQRQKSWEGRMKKREEELAAREKALAEREHAKPALGEAGESPAEEAGETGAAEEQETAAAVTGAAQAVKDGTMTPEHAIKTLTEDFGPEFANLLNVLIEHKANEVAGKISDEKVGGVSKTVDTLINEIIDDRQRDHFESIEDAHPDFMELAESPAFQDWIDSMPDDERALTLRAIDGGNARQVVKVLTAYKAHAASTAGKQDDKGDGKGDGAQVDPAASAAADAAEGVRSSGVRIPDAPQKADGYEEAWDQF